MRRYLIGLVFAALPAFASAQPVIHGTQIIYPAGTRYQTANGPTRCNAPLVIDSAGGVLKMTCGFVDASVRNPADAYANLAPATGPATVSENNLPSDNRALSSDSSKLSSDNGVGLRNDKKHFSY